jgi:di/tricarboxylate transporter
MQWYRLLWAFLITLCLSTPILATDELLALEPVQQLGSQGILVITCMAAILWALLKEYAPPDLLLFFGGILFCLAGVVTFEDFLKGFSTPTLLTLGMLFIFMKALETNGILDWVASHIVLNTPRRSTQIFRLCLPIMGLSTFFSNTALALFYTPFVRKWALEKRMYPSEFLIPIAFCSILGGNLTLISSSSNLVVEALLEDTNGAEVFHFFTITPLGALVAIAGLIFMVTVGYRLLPKRQVQAGPFQPSYNVALELRINAQCLLVGYNLDALSQTYLRNLEVLEIRRGPQVIVSPNGQERIQSEDTLLLFGEVSRLLQLKRVPGIAFVQDADQGVDFSSTYFFEAVLATVSEFVGHTLREMKFKETFGATVVALYRAGLRIEGKLADIKLQPGDVFFLLSRQSLWDKEAVQRNFFLIRNSPAQAPVSMKRAGLTLGLLGVMIAMAYGTGSLVYASCLAVVGILAFRLIEIGSLRKSIHWDLLIQVGSGMVYGKALIVSGVASWVAYHVQPLIGQSPHVFIAFVFFMTMMMSQVITPTACVLIMYPIALTISVLSGFQGDNLLPAIGAVLTIAASTCFLSPIGYQPNMIIYGAGGYKFSDFFRVGLPLTLIVALICVLFIPWWWPITI